MPTNTQANVIRVTTDYDQFNLMTANRDTVRSHIEGIKKSIEKNGNFTQFSPILVNEEMEIIDGQHRFTALKELGLPVHFVVTRGSGVREAREMNKLNKGWSMLDWAKTYANTGYRSYQNFLVLVDEYTEEGLSPSVILEYANGSYEKGMHANFRDGDFILPDQALKRVRANLDALLETIEVEPIMRAASMSQALLVAMSVPNFSLKRMVTKLKEYPQVMNFQTRTDSLRHLEDIYNYHYAAQNRVRFF